MNPGLEPALSLYQANVDVCREIADILVDGTERMERALFKNVRDGMHQAFGAAHSLTSSGGEAPRPPQLEDIVGPYRDAVEAIVKTNSDLVRVVTEHCTRCSRAIADTSAQSPVAGVMAPPALQLESMMKLWTQTSQQMAELAQHLANGAGAVTEPPPPPRKSPRGH